MLKCLIWVLNVSYPFKNVSVSSGSVSLSQVCFNEGAGYVFIPSEIKEQIYSWFLFPEANKT